MWQRLGPYGLAVVGVCAITAVLVAVAARWPVANLSMVYLVVVLWLGARYGTGPAVVAGLLSFLAYDLALVPPVGSFTVSDVGQLPGLLALLVTALVTGQLAAAGRRARETAEARAAETRSLYELATAALRLREVGEALELLRERALAIPAVRLMTVLAGRGPELLPVAGDGLAADALHEVRWSIARGQPVGLSLDGERLRLLRPSGREEQRCILPAGGGAVLLVVGAEEVSPDDLRLLAALLSLAGLLLDRQRASMESERAQALAASDRLKATVLSSISHELKSPIASLRAGLTALLAPQARLAGDQRELVEALDGRADRLDRLVGDLLTMARLEAGGPLHLEPEQLADLVGGVLHRLRPELAAFDLEVRVPEDLPPGLIDEPQLGRVLTNLIENAREWTAPGGRIRVEAHVQGSELALSVANDGPEIPVADLERVFDKFWTGREAGSGLGLAICKRVVEAHGGSIRAENLRRGPRFTLTLPVASAAIPPARRSRPAQRPR